ncbi:MAG TPA: hypothetical protein VD813_15015 [Pseudonocardia sp.]|nr:hypothetical protein [Pseudonocardia sp.]
MPSRHGHRTRLALLNPYDVAEAGDRRPAATRPGRVAALAGSSAGVAAMAVLGASPALAEDTPQSGTGETTTITGFPAASELSADDFGNDGFSWTPESITAVLDPASAAPTFDPHDGPPVFGALAPPSVEEFLAPSAASGLTDGDTAIVPGVDPVPPADTDVPAPPAPDEALFVPGDTPTPSVFPDTALPDTGDAAPQEQQATTATTGEPVILTAAPELVPDAGDTVAFAPVHACPDGFVSRREVSDLVASLTEINATTEQLEHAAANPCSPALPVEPELTKSSHAAVAFSLDDNPKTGLDAYTNFLNTPADLGATPHVYNYKTWAQVFVPMVADGELDEYPDSFEKGFLTAVPPRGSGRTSPFRDVFFNLSGIDDPEAAMRRGSRGPRVGGFTNWELYNVIDRGLERTYCHRWRENVQFGPTRWNGFFQVNCPPFPEGLARPGPDGIAR